MAHDLEGMVFGRLTVLRRDGSIGSSKAWVCQCSCDPGGERLRRLPTGNLLKGNTQSCGCLNRERSTERLVAINRRHGMFGTRVYRIWRGLLHRCLDSKSSSYRFYGARGVTVCERWRDSFEAFYADMGDPPTPAHTIDRRFNDRPYNKANCRWATMKEQQNNRSNNVVIEFAGDSKTLTQWAEHLGFNAKTLQYRIERGWSVERAFTEGIHDEKRRGLIPSRKEEACQTS